MNTLIYPLAGSLITLHIQRRAKKNIILRPHDAGSLHINIPNWLTQKQLYKWLAEHESLLQQVLTKAACTPHLNTLPDWIWLSGERTPLIIIPNTSPIHYHAGCLHLPEHSLDALCHWLWQHAEQTLLPKLAQHATQHRLHLAAMQLSRARTFWGVCRPRTGIRLNWRLIGAPDWVQDYVCLHELAHLTHANHSHDFWQLVQQYCPSTQAAQTWLKQHGNQLFLLG